MMTRTEKTNCRMRVRRIIDDLTKIHMVAGINCDLSIHNAKMIQTQINTAPVAMGRRDFRSK